MIVTSIDIGTVNMGIATLENDKIIFADCIEIHPVGRGKGKMKESEYIPKLKSKLFDNKNIFNLFKKSDIVLVENQMLRVFLLLQFALCGMLSGKNINFKIIRPHDVKRHFDSGTGDHSNNKETAKQLVRTLYPSFLDSLNANKHDDISDCILMCLYWYHRCNNMSSQVKATSIKATLPQSKKRKKKPKVFKNKKKISKITVSPKLADTLQKLKRK